MDYAGKQVLRHSREKPISRKTACTLLDNASGHLKLEYSEVTGEDDRIAIVAKGDLPMKDGRNYRNNYHFLLTFRDGKIASGKEFTDSLHINEIFGAPDSPK